jgi:membrane protease YdiL (CAAX protease family)
MRVILGNAGVLAPGPWRWLRALGWMIVLTVLIVAAFNLVAEGSLRVLPLVTGHPFTTRAAAPQSDKLWGTLAGAVAALLAYAAAVRWGERRAVTELSLRSAPPELLVGLAIGAATMAVVIGTMWLFGWASLQAEPVTAIARALRDSIQAGAIEELLIRLVIFRLLWRAFGIWPALAVAGSFFGLIHIANPGGNWLGALSIVAGEGVGFGLYLLTGRLWASIGAHAAWNFTQGWVFGAIVSGYTSIAGGPLALRPRPGTPEMFTGGSFGPEASLSALVVSLIASAIVLGLAWRKQHFRAQDEHTTPVAAAA